jgi:hypothetical protein
MSGRTRAKLVREQDYVAEVQVTLLDSPAAWAPHLSLGDAEKLDEVRLALRRGDFAAARRHGRVYRLMPVAAD